VTSPSSTTTPRTPNSNPYPYGADPSNDSSSPMTTIIIVCVVGSLALLGGAWGVHSCMRKRKDPSPATIAAGTSAAPAGTTLVYIPGETPAMAAMPSLCYNSPPIPAHPSMETTEVGPGVIIPPPPAYDVATGGRVVDYEGAEVPCKPMRERTDSQWKGLLVSQGRD
jgi:hypothetical protein